MIGFFMLPLATVVATPCRSCAQQIAILRAQQPAKLLCMKVVFVSGFSLFNLRNGP